MFAAAWLLLTPLCGVGQAQAQTPESTSPIADRIDQYFTRLVPFGFSGSVLVARGGEVLVSAGYGLADESVGQANTAATVYQIHSVTKQFTAAAILALEDDGKLQLSDTLGRFFPDAPADKRAITLRQLLTHTSGVVSGTDQYFEQGSRDGIVRKVFETPLAFEPGSSDSYSNLGYAVLAAVVELTSALPYERYLQNRLLERAGMSSTGSHVQSWSLDRLARSYARGTDNGTPLDRPRADWNFVGSGDVSSTVEDLYRWHRALLADRVLSDEARRRLFEPVANDYALGWIVRDTPHGRLVEHDGGSGRGGAANFRRYVDADVVAIMLCNRDGEEMLFGNRIVDQLDDLIFQSSPVVLPPAVGSGETTDLSVFEGNYSGPEGSIRIAGGSGFLTATTRDQGAIDAIFGAAQAPGASAANDAAIRALAALERGDTSVMDGLGGSRIAGFITQRRDRFAAGLGTFTRYSVRGTVPDWIAPSADKMTIVAADFDGGSFTFRLHWSGSELYALGGTAAREPAETRLVPRGNGETFVGFHLPTSSSNEVRFEHDEHGGVSVASIGSLRFERVEKPPPAE